MPVTTFTPGLHVAAAATLDYHCDYHNDEARDVYQGARSTDEMCMLIGSYYPADPRTALSNADRAMYRAKSAGRDRVEMA